MDSSQAEEAGKWMYHIKEAKKLLEGEQTKSGSYVQFIIYIITNKTRAVQAVRHMLSHFLPLSRWHHYQCLHHLHSELFAAQANASSS